MITLKKGNLIFYCTLILISLSHISLADEILFGKLKTGGLVKVGVDRKKENLIFKIIPPAKGKATGKGSKEMLQPNLLDWNRLSTI